MRWLTGVVVGALVAAGGYGAVTALRGSGAVVARAGRHELTVNHLAEIMADGQLPRRTDMAERLAWWWVEYALLAQRLEAGDSLLDSATVLETRWPHARDEIVNRLYARLAAKQHWSETVVDSAYGAGNLRTIDHILIRAPPGMPEDERATRRRRAEAIHARLASGASWNVESRASDDVNSRTANGTLGVITWGDTDPDFERVAFGLAPGELSQVVETRFGYHLIRRPPLADVREMYANVVRDTLYWRMRDAFAERLIADAGFHVQDDAVTLIREAAAQPNRLKSSRETIAAFGGRELTVADFIRWLQVLPDEIHMDIQGSTDAELRELVRKIVRYELEWQAARDAGIAVSDSGFAILERQVAWDVDELRRLLGIDTLLRKAGSAADSDPTATVAADYLARWARDLRNEDFAAVPPYLADKLRAETEWRIRYGLLERVLARAEEMRSADTATAAGAPGDGEGS